MNTEILINMVTEYFEVEAENKKYNIQVRKEKGLDKDATLWIPTLDGSTAYRLGELAERCQIMWSALNRLCEIVDFDYSRLVSTVKSIRRWEEHGGKYDRIVHCTDSRGFIDYISKVDGLVEYENAYYTSTGRKKKYVE